MIYNEWLEKRSIVDDSNNIDGWFDVCISKHQYFEIFYHEMMVCHTNIQIVKI
jgi:hypothetical protein